MGWGNTMKTNTYLGISFYTLLFVAAAIYSQIALAGSEHGKAKIINETGAPLYMVYANAHSGATFDSPVPVGQSVPSQGITFSCKLEKGAKCTVGLSTRQNDSNGMVTVVILHSISGVGYGVEYKVSNSPIMTNATADGTFVVRPN